MTNLLKNNQSGEWTSTCQEALKDLKRVVTEAPILSLPDPSVPFEVYTDASDFATRGVLMQEALLRLRAKS